MFSNAACVVTLIDRLAHKAEIVKLEGKSYRMKEAEGRAARKTTERAARRMQKKPSSAPALPASPPHPFTLFT